MKKAIFLTFDDTLVTTLSGRRYSIHGEDWKFINKTINFIKDLINKENYIICLIINQAEISKGIIPLKTFIRKLDLVVTTLERDLGLKTNSIKYEYCDKQYLTGTDKQTYQYLPNPGMIYSLAVDYELDVVNSILISNGIGGKEIATNCGINCYIDSSTLITDV